MSREEVRELVEKAKRSLRSSRNVLEDGDCDFAVSRAYYAMFYAAKAALLARGVSRSKHSGVIAAFGEVFVRTGALDRAHHDALRGAFTDRGEADYGRGFPGRDEVERRLTQASEFVRSRGRLLRGEGFDV